MVITAHLMAMQYISFCQLVVLAERRPQCAEAPELLEEIARALLSRQPSSSIALRLQERATYLRGPSLISTRHVGLETQQISAAGL